MRDLEGNHIPYSSGDIVQIIPAVDWYAVFVGEDGKEIFDPVVCWALVEDVDGEEVSHFVGAIDNAAVNDGLSGLSTTASNFQRFQYHPGGTFSYPTRLGDWLHN